MISAELSGGQVAESKICRENSSCSWRSIARHAVLVSARTPLPLECGTGTFFIVSISFYPRFFCCAVSRLNKTETTLARHKLCNPCTSGIWQNPLCHSNEEYQGCIPFRPLMMLANSFWTFRFAAFCNMEEHQRTSRKQQENMFFGLGSTSQTLEQAHRLQVCQQRHKAAQEDHSFDAFLHDSYFWFFLCFSAFHFPKSLPYPHKLHRSSQALTLSCTMQTVLLVL